MPVHENEICPRCQQPFECKVGDVSNCQCNGLYLNEEERAHIAARYSDCLCIHCLRDLKNKYTMFKEKFFPDPL
ncbi:hypothetical protein HNQ91_004942 [Filimonas zeae]|uniref:Cysteine-rich CWC n=1 Tax=Filimonas zeae TaxID=1737353 RepID=A0A917MYY4_9BACT|nr:cysteine-rich CWC family protein [Filimonas zeae]MDR6341865.1 hypothetical protein [Filimonas zeae]GGH80032.1 hypothetical protein GCM10011379_50300 [Filimonas zeae]